MIIDKCLNHSDRKAKVRNLCQSCYTMWLSNNNPSYKETRRKANKTHYDKNKDFIIAKAKARSEANPDLVSKKNKLYYELNKEKIKEYHRQTNSERYENNKDYIKSKVKEYRTNNRGKINALSKKYKCSKINRTPEWLTKEHLTEISNFYIKAREMSILIGVEHQVDHIVPLQGKNVSGLHVPWNLQILTNTENQKKSNKLRNDNE